MINRANIILESSAGRGGVPTNCELLPCGKMPAYPAWVQDKAAPTQSLPREREMERSLFPPSGESWIEGGRGMVVPFQGGK